MLRFLYVASLVGCLLIAPAVAGHGDGSSQAPSQALVRINSTGQLEVLGRASKPVMETMQGTRMVTKTELQQRIQKEKVVKDGVEQVVDVPVTVQVEKMVPETYTYAVTKMVYETSVQKFPAATNGFRRDFDKAEIALYDLAGNRLSVTAVEGRLQDWTLVLISSSGKALDRKFAGLFKPTTIVVGIPPQAIGAYPAIQAPVAPGQVIPQPVVPQLNSPPGAPSAARDVPSGLTPVAFLAADAMPQLPNSPEPKFAFAKVWGDKTIALRTEDEKTQDMTCMVTREEERTHEGKLHKVVVCVPQQIQKTIEIRETVKIATNQVSVTKAPNKVVTTAELPSVLAVETLAMVSADGKPVDPLWQRNLREGTLVIVAPTSPAAAPFPVIMPSAPAYAPPPPVEIPQPVVPQSVPPKTGE